MKRKCFQLTKRIIAVCLAAGMAVGMTACSSSGGSSKSDSAASGVKATGAYAGLDISTPVTLTFYNLGDVPTDMEKVQKEANEKYFQPLLNCTVNFEFLSWSDYKTKYDLLFAGGDNVDLVYTSNWCFYTQEAGKGAFKELSMDFIKKYMPQTYQSQAKVSWDQIAINGKIYAVPQNFDNTISSYKYVAYREDLRKKYNLPEITDIASMQQYLFTVAEKDKGIQAVASAGENDELRNILLFQQNNLARPDPSYDFMYQLKDSKAPAESDIFYVYTSDYFKNFCETMATWANKGVWSKNAINNTVSVNDSYANGRSSLIAWNGSVFTYGKKLDESKTGTTAYADVTPNSIVKAQPLTGDAVAVAHNSKNPERAAMALDLMKNNKDLNNLLEGGIKGTHYVVNSDGTRSLGKDASKYAWDGWSWGIRSADQLTQSDIDKRQTGIESKITSRIIKTDIDGFTFDESNVKTEMSVLNSVRDEYLPSFELGAYGSNTSKIFEEFKQKINQAGLEKIQKEYLTQYKAYLAKNK